MSFPHLIRCASVAMRASAAAWILLLAATPARPADVAKAPSAPVSAPARVSAAAPQLLVMLRSPPEHARVDGSYGGAGYGDAARARSQARIGARIAAAHGFAVVTQWPMPTL